MMSNINVKGGFLWKIENFTYCGHCKGRPIISPVFSLVTQFDTDWRLFLYPRGKTNEDFVSCYLEYHEENTVHVKSVDFDLSVLTKDGKIYHTCKGRSVFVRKGKKFGFNQFCDREYIFKAKGSVLPKDVLSINCNLKVDVKDDDEEKGCDSSLKELSQKFRNLLHSGDFSDMTLGADGDEYQVHQFFIASRAPNLARELGITSNISPSYSVKLNDISPSVLKEFLIYLYSGQVEVNDADILAGLYNVAQRYDLKRLSRHIFPGPAQCSARTRIRVVRNSFLWCIKDFSKRKMGLGLPLHMFVDLEIIRLVLTCSVVGNSDNIQIFFRRVHPWVNQKIYLSCKVSLKSVEGSKEIERWFDGNNSESQFPILSLKRKTVFNNLICLHDDELKISLDFYASDGQQRSRRENSNSLWTSAVEENLQYLSLCQLKEDLKSLWNTVNFTDLLVKVRSGEELMVHKAILATRSPILLEIIREGLADNSFYLNLLDMDLEIAWELLKYLYRGDFHINTFEDYVKLYVAAVKFNIVSLTTRCAHHLVTNVTNKNVCELLILGDRFEDVILLVSAQEYISANKHAVLSSDEWKQLLKDHPLLGSKLLLWLSNQLS